MNGKTITDKDGSIDHAEFRHMLNDIGLILNDQEFHKLMKRIDKNDDGSVDLIEWWRQFHTEATSGMPGAAGGRFCPSFSAIFNRKMQKLPRFFVHFNKK